MLRDKVIQAVECIFLGPFAVVIGLCLLALVTALLMFFVPAAVYAILWAAAAALLFLFDFLIHPSLLKLWGVICFFAACVLVYTWLNKDQCPLPLPDLRRGREIDAGKKAKERAQNAIYRRREALRKHPIL